MQPMDVSLFRSLKSSWKDAVRKWRIDKDGAFLTKEHFAPVLKTALDSLDLKKNFGNGFERCGLSPFNENAINYSKLLKFDDADAGTHSDQISSEPNAEVTLQQNESFFTSHLNSDILTELKNHDHSIEWSGPIEFNELYKF